MRLIHIALTSLLLAAAPVASFAANVRAIAFEASHERGATDPKLARYEGTLRGTLRFESFRYLGESSKSVAPGSQATLSAGGVTVEVSADKSGAVKVTRGGVTVDLSRAPAVLMGSPTAKGGVSGVIVMAE